MIWDESTIEKLSFAFQEKHKQMFDRTSTDRKNRSALWNKYIKNYECKIIRNDVPGKSQVIRNSDTVIKNMVNLVNFRNDWLSNSLVIPNPDRYGQWIIVSRDMAERILAIGMI